MPENMKDTTEHDLYQPKNKSPRNSEVDVMPTNTFQVKINEESNKRQSLNLENSNVMKHNIPKSYTDANISNNKTGQITTPTPQSPNYRQLVESSATTSPGYSPELSPIASISSEKPLVDELSKKYDIVLNSPTMKKPTTPVYENVLTTISITYKSPSKKAPPSPTHSNKDGNIYEDVMVVHTEKAMIPTSVASLPAQEATVPPPVKKHEQTSSQPNLVVNKTEILSIPSNESRPKSLNDLEDYSQQKVVLETNASTNAIFDSVSHVNTSMTHNLNSENTICNSETLLDSSMTQKALGSQNTLSSSRSSDLNNKNGTTVHPMYQVMDNLESPSDFSLSEVVNSSTENLNTSQSSMSFPSPTLSPNVSPTQLIESPDSTSQNISTPSSIKVIKEESQNSLLQCDGGKHDIEMNNDKPILNKTGLFNSNSEESDEMMNTSENKSDLTFFNISELASLSDDAKYKNLTVPHSDNLIEFSPVEQKDIADAILSSDKRKSCESDENSIYQQVKYFRRSIHEVNALLDVNGSSDSSDQFHEHLIDDAYENVSYNNENDSLNNADSVNIMQDSLQDVGNQQNNIMVIPVSGAPNELIDETDNYDSLEINNPHVYENCDTSLDVTELTANSNVYENVEFRNRQDSISELLEEDSISEGLNVNKNSDGCKPENCLNNTEQKLENTCNRPDNEQAMDDKKDASEFKNILSKFGNQNADNQTKPSNDSLRNKVHTEEAFNNKLRSSKTQQEIVDNDIQPKRVNNHKEVASHQSPEISIGNTVENLLENSEKLVNKSLNNTYKNDVPEIKNNCDKSENNSVKSLMNKFEQTTKTNSTAKKENETPPKVVEENKVVYKTYDKDSLPPCLRAKKLKHSVKTRSLDEEEFKREFGIHSLQRRKSLDEGIAFKGNTLPKTLNQPKKLPVSDDKLDLHLTHSSENVNLNSSEQKLNRERIEKYKEERRKFLHDKYRSESFKEDKDVLLSRLKTTKTKREDDNKISSTNKSTENVVIEEFTHDSLEPIEADAKLLPKVSSVESVKEDGTDEAKSLNPRESFRMRAAKFEKTNAAAKVPCNLPKHPVKTKSVEKVEVLKKDAVCDVTKNCEVLSDINVDFLRNKKKEDEFLKSERRRRTYESVTREREGDAEAFKRTSLESRSPRYV